MLRASLLARAFRASNHLIIFTKLGARSLGIRPRTVWCLVTLESPKADWSLAAW